MSVNPSDYTHRSAAKNWGLQILVRQFGWYARINVVPGKLIRVPGHAERDEFFHHEEFTSKKTAKAPGTARSLIWRFS